MTLSPYTAGGVLTDEAENPQKASYQALHHQFIASALTTKLAREINPDFQIGCMMVRLTTYPATHNPKDILLAQKQNDLNLFVLDVHARGEYPTYMN